MTAPLLAAEGLALHFGAIPALVDVAIDVAGGEVVAIVGESGSGKTTLLRVLSGLLAPDAGQVRWLGQDVHAMGEAARRRVVTPERWARHRAVATPDVDGRRARPVLLPRGPSRRREGWHWHAASVGCPASMTSALPEKYDPATLEPAVTQKWLQQKAFGATPDSRENRYVVMMPLPNVTGALHMGHAMDNVMQDLLIRWHRMRGDNTLWQPGTDHASIATQAVVEKRLFELEGKTRHDIGRERLVERIWAWKDEYQQRIVRQQQQSSARNKPGVHQQQRNYESYCELGFHGLLRA